MTGWQESEAALDELMRSEKLVPSLETIGRLDATNIDGPVEVNQSAWKRYNVTIDSKSLSRKNLFDIAEEVRNGGGRDWVELLHYVLAWGIGPRGFRNVSRITADIEAKGRPEANRILADAAGHSFAGEVAEAYGAIYKKIRGLGPGYFTKFLHLCSDQSPTLIAPWCLILDSRVQHAVFALTGEWFSMRTASDYEAFCAMAYRCAQRNQQNGCTPQDVEFRLYQLGILIRSARWRWLHAEASLYRGGAREVRFDDIVTRLAGR